MIAPDVIRIHGGEAMVLARVTRLLVGALTVACLVLLGPSAPSDALFVLADLTTEALARGERLDELSVTRPSLEEVYLELTADQDLEVTGS